VFLFINNNNMAAGLVIVRGSLITVADILRPFDSNATLSANDLVNIKSGQLELAATGERIGGIIVRAATSASTAVQVNVTPFQTVVMDNDNISTTFAVTDVYSSFFDITGATAAQIVDTSTVGVSATTTVSGSLFCIAYNPQGIRDDLNTDLSVGTYMIRETQNSLT